MKNLCLSGGVALNCVANYKIGLEKIFDQIWVQPASGDAGSSIGSAMYLYYHILGKERNIEENGNKGLEEERRLAYVGITRAKKEAIISFSMNRYYQGDWIDSMASRFLDELPDDLLTKNSFFDEDKNELEDFEFNQDFDFDEEDKIRSPGWIRYQKRIK